MLEAARGATDPVVRAMASAMRRHMIDLVTVGGSLGRRAPVDQREDARAVLEAAGDDEGLGALLVERRGRVVDRAADAEETVVAAEQGSRIARASG